MLDQYRRIHVLIAYFHIDWSSWKISIPDKSNENKKKTDALHFYPGFLRKHSWLFAKVRIQSIENSFQFHRNISHYPMSLTKVTIEIKSQYKSEKKIYQENFSICHQSLSHFLSIVATYRYNSFDKVILVVPNKDYKWTVRHMLECKRDLLLNPKSK